MIMIFISIADHIRENYKSVTSAMVKAVISQKYKDSQLDPRKVEKAEEFVKWKYHGITLPAVTFCLNINFLISYL